MLYQWSITSGGVVHERALDKLIEVRKALYRRNRDAFIEAHVGSDRQYQQYTIDLMLLDAQIYIILGMFGVPFEKFDVNIDVSGRLE
jgi:hypothetical protein